jgi:hypothetical protein
LVICDEKGAAVDGDQIMAIIAKAWAESGRLSGGGVVATVMSNLGLERFLNKLDLKLERTQVGDRYVMEKMRQGGFNLGGEQSGHVILSDVSTTGDGMIAALQVLAVIVKSGKPMSTLARQFEPVPQRLENVRFSGGKPLEHADVKQAIADAEARHRGCQLPSGLVVSELDLGELLIGNFEAAPPHALIGFAQNDVAAPHIVALGQVARIGGADISQPRHVPWPPLPGRPEHVRQQGLGEAGRHVHQQAEYLSFGNRLKMFSNRTNGPPLNKGNGGLNNVPHMPDIAYEGLFRFLALLCLVQATKALGENAQSTLVHPPPITEM